MVVMNQKSGKFIQFSRFVPLLAWNFRPINKIIAETYLLPLLTLGTISTADDVAGVVIVVRHRTHAVIRVYG